MPRSAHAILERVDPLEFREALLRLMEAKEHWAWGAFTTGKVPKERLHIHLEQEYATYVRDFPVLVGRAYVQCPVPIVRRALAENLYEEETGGIAAGRPHPELFLEYPRGLGMDLTRFEQVELLPGAARYRAFLDEATTARGWGVAAAVTTVFIEGTSRDRLDADPSTPKPPPPPLEEHPLVKHYGLPIAHLALTKAHRSVEGQHRAAAWKLIVGHVAAADQPGVIEAMQSALAHWQAYRDDVARACGL